MPGYRLELCTCTSNEVLEVLLVLAYLPQDVVCLGRMLRQLPTVVFEGQLAAMLHNLQRRLGLTFLRSFAQLPQHSVQERPLVGEVALAVAQGTFAWVIREIVRMDRELKAAFKVQRAFCVAR